MRVKLRSVTRFPLVGLLALAAVAAVDCRPTRPAGTENAERDAIGVPISSSFIAALPREKAEVAVYEIGIEGDERPLRAVLVLSVVPYDPVRQVETSADDPAAVATLKWRFFHRLFESPRKSYQLEASEFFYLDPTDLRPFKWSRGSASWEGGGCCALGLRQADGSLSDPWGGPTPRPAHMFPASLIPLLVRAMDFQNEDRHVLEVPLLELESWDPHGKFQVARFHGRSGHVEATLAGREKVQLPRGDGQRQAEKIVVRYEQPADTVMTRLIHASRGAEEIYWRSTEPSRQLLRLDTQYYDRPLSMRWLEGAVIDYGRQGLPESLSRHLEAGMRTGS